MKKLTNDIARLVNDFLKSEGLRIKVEICEDEKKIKEVIITKSSIEETEGKDDNLNVKLDKVLNQLGFQAKGKGYKYAREAVTMCYNDDSFMEGITKKLYPTLAVKYQTTAVSVERLIRNAIGTAILNGDMEKYDEIFGNTISPMTGAPTNWTFITHVVRYLHRKRN